MACRDCSASPCECEPSGPAGRAYYENLLRQAGWATPEDHAAAVAHGGEMRNVVHALTQENAELRAALADLTARHWPEDEASVAYGLG